MTKPTDHPTKDSLNAQEVTRYFECSCGQQWDVDETYELHHLDPADQCPECGARGKRSPSSRDSRRCSLGRS